MLVVRFCVRCCVCALCVWCRAAHVVIAVYVCSVLSGVASHSFISIIPLSMCVQRAYGDCTVWGVMAGVLVVCCEMRCGWRDGDVISCEGSVKYGVLSVR